MVHEKLLKNVIIFKKDSITIFIVDVRYKLYFRF